MRTRAALYNRHHGETAFVIGTGPSLSSHLDEVAMLRDHLTIGTSRLVQWTAFPFVPTYHLISEWPQVMERHNFIWEGVKERFLCVPTANVRQAHDRRWTTVEKAPERYIVHVGLDCFGEALTPLRNGRSSANFSTQLLYHMGVETVYLVGCDTTRDGHAWAPSEVRNDGDPSRVWAAWARTRQDAERAGRRLIDCTPGGELSKQGVLPYVALKEACSGVSAGAR